VGVIRTLLGTILSLKHVF